MKNTAAHPPSPAGRRRAILDRLHATGTEQPLLAELLATPPDNAERVIELITCSPSLSARVLSVINSAALGMPRRIYSVRRAVGLLGSARSRFLALAHGLHMLTEQLGLPADLGKVLWFNSIAKACAAQIFCQVTDPPRADDAFALGLISDLTVPLFLLTDPAFYESRPAEQAATRLQAERRHFGIDHAQAGAHLLAQWSAADHLVAQVRHHHDDPLAEAQPPGPSPLQLAVYLSSLLPHHHEPSCTSDLAWVAAVHARFLAGDYASPDRFLEQVNYQARLIQGRLPQTLSSTFRQLERQLVQAICTDVPGLVANLYKLEGSLLCQQRDIAALRSQALTDPLTGLLNRRGFTTLAEQRLEWGRNGNKSLCIILGDLDGFKQVNDTFGHEAGDEVLVAVANLLRSSVRGEDLIGRIGGDEFALLADQLDHQAAQRVAGHLSDNINGRKVLLRNGQQVTVHMSFGAVYVQKMDDDQSLADLLASADQAMYYRKRNGKRGLHFLRHDSAPVKTAPEGL